MTGIPTGNRFARVHGDGSFGAPGPAAQGEGGGRGEGEEHAARNRFCRGAYLVLQWTWGIVQNLVGLAVMACVRAGHPERRPFRFHGAVVVPWGRGGASMGMGMFIFFGHRSEADAARLLVHEYGHTIQSILLGPLYLPVIGLPSVLWAGLPRFVAARREGRVSYFDFYPERWANFAGARVTHRPAPDRSRNPEAELAASE